MAVQVELKSPRSRSDFSLVEIKEHILEFNFIVKLATSIGRKYGLQSPENMNVILAYSGHKREVKREQNTFISVS